MSDYNNVGIIGRATRYAELKYTSNGTAVTNFSIAVNRSIPPKEEGGEWKDETSFIDVQIWGRLAESKAKGIVKGKQLLVSGAVKQERWEKNGEQRSKVIIVAESIQFLADPRGSDDRSETRQEDKRRLRENAEKTADSETGNNTFDDDLPF